MHSAAYFETVYLIQKVVTYVKTFVQFVLEQMFEMWVAVAGCGLRENFKFWI